MLSWERRGLCRVLEVPLETIVGFNSRSICAGILAKSDYGHNDEMDHGVVVPRVAIYLLHSTARGVGTAAKHSRLAGLIG
jgi:hypothetical protein